MHLTFLHVIADKESCDLVHSRELVKSAEHLLRNLIPSTADLWCEPGFADEQVCPRRRFWRSPILGKWT